MIRARPCIHRGLIFESKTWEAFYTSVQSRAEGVVALTQEPGAAVGRGARAALRNRRRPSLSRTWPRRAARGRREAPSDSHTHFLSPDKKHRKGKRETSNDGYFRSRGRGRNFSEGTFFFIVLTCKPGRCFTYSNSFLKI